MENKLPYMQKLIKIDIIPKMTVLRDTLIGECLWALVHLLILFYCVLCLCLIKLLINRASILSSISQRSAVFVSHEISSALFEY